MQMTFNCVFSWKQNVVFWWKFQHETQWHGNTFSITHWPFVRGIYWSPMNSPHKGPVIWRFDGFWCNPAQAGEQTVKLSVIWDGMTLMQHHYCFVPKGLIGNKSASISVKSWKWRPEPMVTQFTDVHVRHQALMSHMGHILQLETSVYWLMLLI